MSHMARICAHPGGACGAPARAGPRRRRGAARPGPLGLGRRGRTGRRGSRGARGDQVELAVQRAGLDQEAGEWGVGHEVEPEREPCEFAPAGVGFVQGRPPTRAAPGRFSTLSRKKSPPQPVWKSTSACVVSTVDAVRPVILAGGACTGRRRGAFGFGGAGEGIGRRRPRVLCPALGSSGAGGCRAQAGVLRLHGGGEVPALCARACGSRFPCRRRSGTLPAADSSNGFRLGAQDVPAARPRQHGGGAPPQVEHGLQDDARVVGGQLATRGRAGWSDGAGRVPPSSSPARRAGAEEGPLDGARRRDCAGWVSLIPARAPRRPLPAPPRGCRARPR